MIQLPRCILITFFKLIDELFEMLELPYFMKLCIDKFTIGDFTRVLEFRSNKETNCEYFS